MYPFARNGEDESGESLSPAVEADDAVSFCGSEFGLYKMEVDLGISLITDPYRLSKACWRTAGLFSF